MNAAGYVMIWQPDHPSLVNSQRKYMHEHRLVMEQKLGRLLEPQETVHHLDGDRANNDINNLELWSGSHPSGQRKDEGKPHCPSCTCFRGSDLN